MTLARALTEVKREYERAMKMDCIRDPLAYALYQVWKKADKEGK